MELKELTDKTLALFDANSPQELSDRIYKTVQRGKP